MALAALLLSAPVAGWAQEAMEAPQPDLPPISGTATDVPGLPAPAGVAPDGAASDAATSPASPVRPSFVPGGPELLPGVLDSQIQKCWSVPVMTGDLAEGGIARIRVTFLPDGSLAAPPAIIDKPAGRLGGVFAESAAAAITKCAPYKLPPEQYESWKDVTLIFDTLDF
ncbi:cell envelope integrity protein TolA [Aureimonas glaciei]|uniref:cell envelope integrity protein TolA n=1 Tax=Aureimonas glaciei TaxID=1776957 RepID=UPI00166BCACF|nr:cell envelope integrity protein TolA [Aureimonas glaciei]